MYVFNCDGVRKANREYLPLKECGVVIQAYCLDYRGMWEESPLELKVIIFDTGGMMGRRTEDCFF